MKSNYQNATDKIIELALSAKTLADRVDQVQKLKTSVFTRTGKLNKAYNKIKRASVLLMEVSYTIETEQEAGEAITQSFEKDQFEENEFSPSNS